MIINDNDLTRNRELIRVRVEYPEGMYEHCSWSVRKADNREIDEPICKVRLLNTQKNINE